MRIWIAVALVLVSFDSRAQEIKTAEPVRLFAAGSLRGVLTELMKASGVPAQSTFGPSGLLQKLSADARAGAVTLFTRNRLCLLAVGADYGLTVIKGARPEADKLAAFILSASGQAILSKYGFSPRYCHETQRAQCPEGQSAGGKEGRYGGGHHQGFRRDGREVSIDG